MSYTTLSTTILIVAVMLVCGKAVSGYKAGATRSLADLALLIFSAALGALISVTSASVVGDPLYESVRSMGFYQDIVAQIGDIRSLAIILTGIVGAVILFVPVFLIIYAIGSLILNAAFKAYAADISDRGDEQTVDKVSLYARDGKKIGAAVGGVCGLVILVVIMTPLAGILKNTKALFVALEECFDTDIIEESEDDSFFAYSDDLMLSVVYASGAEGIFNTLTAVEHGGHTTTLSKEIEVLGGIRSNEIAEVIDEIVKGNAEDAQKLLEDAKKSIIVEALMHSVVRNAADRWLAYEPYLGIQRPSLGEGRMFDNFLNEILYVCAQSEPDTFSSDMLTLINVNGIFAERRSEFENGSYSSIISAFEDGELLDELRAELGKNPNMQRIIYAIDDMLMTVIAGEIADMKYSDYDREVLYRRIANAMNSTQYQAEDERIDALAGFVTDAFDEYNAYLPESLGDDLAGVLLERVNSFGSVSIYDISSFFSSYIK